MHNKFLCLGVHLAVLLGWQTTASAHPAWDKATPTELAEDKPQIEPEAPAEILSYRLEVDDTHEGYRNLTTKIRYKIFDPSRAMDITRIGRFWNGEANPYYDIGARLTLPDGTVHDFGKNDLRERSVAEEGHANGLLGKLGSKSEWEVNQRFLAVTGVVKGAILDVWESQPRVARSDWLMNPIQETDVPIRRFEYLSHYVEDPKVEHRVFILNPNGGQLADDKKSHVMKFHAENLSSLPTEPSAAPRSYFSLTIIETYEYLEKGLGRRSHKVATPDSVPMSIGPWAYYATREDYNDADRGYPSKRVREEAAELVAGAANDREKAVRIYRFVQSRYQRFRKRADLENEYTRYIDSVDELIDLGKIDSTLIDPIDFYYLYISLARSAGLECHSVFHAMRTDFPFRIDLVSENFLRGHSVGIKINNAWVLCNPCSEVPLAFGELPCEVENQPALMALSHQQVFLNVPSPAAESSQISVTGDLALDLEGNLEGDCVWTFTGHRAYAVRVKLHDTGQESWPKIIPSVLHRESSNADIKLLKVDGLDTPEEPVRIHVHMRWAAYAAVMGNRLILAPAVLSEGLSPELTESKRKTPVYFEYPSAETDTLVIHLPSDYLLGAVPKPLTAHSGDFSYALSIQQDSAHHTLSVERKTENRAIDVPVANYGRTSDWFRRQAAADGISLVLSPGANATPAKVAAIQN